MSRYSNRQNDISFEIIKHLGVIDKSETGWSKEVNLVEWNGNPAKIDIREWDPRHEHMSRGITLHKNEMLELLRILIRWYGVELGAKGIGGCDVPRSWADRQDDATFSDAGGSEKNESLGQSEVNSDYEFSKSMGTHEIQGTHEIHETQGTQETTRNTAKKAQETAKKTAKKAQGAKETVNAASAEDSEVPF